MAKQKKETGKDISKYPSAYGSHDSMVDHTATETLEKEGIVICKDDFGAYETPVNRLDTGLADPNRWGRVDNQ